MKAASRIVISASRRTDIPAFYMKWFMQQIDNGFFEIVNPYNKRVSILTATPEKIHTIVFWSKNFGPFIQDGYGEKLEAMGYHLFFNFTVNSESDLLEPNVPPLRTRLEQMAYLSRHYDPRGITWRFDPICFYRATAGKVRHNLKDFEQIAEFIADCGITRCITSFVDLYAKIRRRTLAFIKTSMPDFAFIDPPPDKKLDILQRMETVLAKHHIRLQTCCENELIKALPSDSKISGASCIPNHLLAELFGGKLSLRKDAGQRRKQGCGCLQSVDIGSYDRHPCYHNCLFCYANPAHA